MYGDVNENAFVGGLGAGSLVLGARLERSANPFRLYAGLEAGAAFVPLDPGNLSAFGLLAVPGRLPAVILPALVAGAVLTFVARPLAVRARPRGLSSRAAWPLP